MALTIHPHEFAGFRMGTLRIASQRDGAAARALPDQYVRLGSAPRERVFELLTRHWSVRTEQDRRELGDILVAMFRRLESPASVTDLHRDDCESLVVHWIERTP